MVSLIVMERIPAKGRTHHNSALLRRFRLCFFRLHPDRESARTPGVSLLADLLQQIYQLVLSNTALQLAGLRHS